MSDPIRLEDIDDDFIRNHPDEVEAFLASHPERTKLIWSSVMYVGGNWRTFERVSICGNGPTVTYWTIPEWMRTNRGPHDVRIIA